MQLRFAVRALIQANCAAVTVRWCGEHEGGCYSDGLGPRGWLGWDARVPSDGHVRKAHPWWRLQGPHRVNKSKIELRVKLKVV